MKKLMILIVLISTSFVACKEEDRLPLELNIYTGDINPQTPEMENSAMNSSGEADFPPMMNSDLSPSEPSDDQMNDSQPVPAPHSNDTQPDWSGNYQAVGSQCDLGINQNDYRLVARASAVRNLFQPETSNELTLEVILELNTTPSGETAKWQPISTICYETTTAGKTVSCNYDGFSFVAVSDSQRVAMWSLDQNYQRKEYCENFNWYDR